MSGPLVVDPTRGVVLVGGRTVDLLPRELALLTHFLDNQGLVLSRDQILDAVWAGEYPTDRTVDDHVYRLRKKLEPLLGRRILFTARGIGYMFLCPSAPEADLLRSLADDRCQEAYLRLLRGCILRGAGRQVLALVHDPPPGCRAGPGEKILALWLTGDLESLVAEVRPGGPRKARVLGALVAEDLFGIRAALSTIDAAVQGNEAFTADARLLRAEYMVKGDNLPGARAELDLAAAEIGDGNLRVLKATLFRVRAMLSIRQGMRDRARGEINAGLKVAADMGIIREQAWLGHLSAQLGERAGSQDALSLLRDNCLGTDYLVMARDLAIREIGWRGEFRAMARAYGLSSLAREFRRAYRPR